MLILKNEDAPFVLYLVEYSTWYTYELYFNTNGEHFRKTKSRHTNSYAVEGRTDKLGYTYPVEGRTRRFN